MVNLQSVEQALLAINPTVFQELCDSFLAIRNENYKAFSRIGSQTGKQKTTRGTPDSFFLLPNGNYLFIETTTDVSTKNKLANDIKACFDVKKSKISLDKIEEIILCFNFNIDQSKIEELQQLAKSFNSNVIIDYWSLDRLAFELFHNHRNLANKYLNIPIDTGQVVSIEQFVEEYDHAAQAISTPLSNTFFHKEEEKQQLKNALHNFNFIILNGVSGVGKTKLAIETIKDFLQDNYNFHAYCISYKSYDILTDLYQYFDNNKNYLLFIDDANRIDNLEQIIGFYKTRTLGKFKIIITVRDYAYREIYLRCSEFAPHTINITKLTNEQITDIISSKDFNIQNYNYQKQIIRIADGNPRIAIMASLLAIKEQKISALWNVSNIFEQYFTTFTKDNNYLADKFNIKCLGIIAFFNTIPCKDKNLSISILEKFDIDYYQFIKVVEQLEKLELVEIKYEYVKISEQNLANFFFYKTFIDRELLSFETLLTNYFDSHTYRIQDCLIPIHNNFDTEKVSEKLTPHLKRYLSQTEDDEQSKLSLLKEFWFYLELETLEYIASKVKHFPITDKYKDQIKSTNKIYRKTGDNILELLSNFFRGYKYLKESLELGFEYIKNCPDLLPDLLKKITDLLVFAPSDHKSGFYRQLTLFELLIKGLKNKEQPQSKIFFELSKTFLLYRFNSSEFHNNHITVVKYLIDNNQYIQKFRAKIWHALNLYFQQFPAQAIEVLKSYAEPTPDVIKEIMGFDLTYIIKIVDKNLTNESFIHCFYVQKQIRWCKEKEVYHPRFEELSLKFTNPVYEMYLKLDWDIFRDKDIFEYKNYHEYDRIKEADVRKFFVFKSTKEIQLFFERLSIISSDFRREWYFGKFIEIIINANFEQNFSIGYELLIFLIDADIAPSYKLRLEFITYLNKQEQIEKIWNLIQKKDFTRKTEWKLSFFYMLHKDMITDIQINRLLATITEINNSIYLYFPNLSKYLEIDSNIFQKILLIINKINGDNNIYIETSIDFFADYFDYLKQDFDLLKQAYLQQNKNQHNFDYEGKAFLKILKQDINFLFEYVQSIYQEENYYMFPQDHRNLGFVWEIDGIETELIKIFDLYLAKYPYAIGIDHFCSVFFDDINCKYNNRVNKFIMRYIKNNINDILKINLIVDIVRCSKHKLFTQVLLYFIYLNQNVEIFKKILWRGNLTFWEGEQNVGDIEAADWQKILSIVNKSNIGYKLLPIKKYLNEQIEYSKKHAELERKRKFLGSYS